MRKDKIRHLAKFGGQSLSIFISMFFLWEARKIIQLFWWKICTDCSHFPKCFLWCRKSYQILGQSHYCYSANIYQYKISALICSDLLDLYSDGQSLFWLFSICITWFIKLCHMSSQPEPTDTILIIIICIVITHGESCHIIFFHEVFANLWVCPYKLQKRFLSSI